MSVKMERLLRNRCKSTEIPSQKVKRRKSDFSLAVDFISESLSSSSPIKLDVSSDRKTRKKKIRSTQDFNTLSSSLTSQESDELSKPKTKKAKKTKVVYNLPKISHVVEDFSNRHEKELSDSKYDESRQNKRGRKKSKKEEYPNNLIYESKRKKKIKKDQEVVKNEDESIEEYKSANSTVSSSGKEDSDIEIVMNIERKNKRSTEDTTNDVESYAKRIKLLFTDTAKISPKYVDGSNSSAVFTHLSSKNEQSSSPISTKQDKTDHVSKQKKTSSTVSSPLPKTKLSNKSHNISRKISSTPNPTKLHNDSFDMPKEEEKSPKNVKKHSISLLENLPTEHKTKKMKRESSSLLFETEVSDGDDDVFNTTAEKLADEADLIKNKSSASSSTTKETRMSSVRSTSVGRRNSSAASVQLSSKKQQCSRKMSTKQIATTESVGKQRKTSSTASTKVLGSTPLSITKLSNNSHNVSRKISSTPHPKKKLWSSSCDAHTNEEVSPENVKKRSISLLENLSPKTEIQKVKKKRSSSLFENEIFDEGNEVFNTTFEMQADSSKVVNNDQIDLVKIEFSANHSATNPIRMMMSSLQNFPFETEITDSRKKGNVNQAETIKNDLNNGVKKTRKSVRFQTSNQSIQNINNIHLSSGDAKRNSTFEISSPTVLTQENSFHNVIGNEDKIVNKTVTPYKHFEANVSRQSMNDYTERQRSVELISPANKSMKKSVNDRKLNVTTKKVGVGVPSIALSEMSLLGVGELNKTNEPKEIPEQVKSKPTKDEGFETVATDIETTPIRQNTPKLCRTATFTKETPNLDLMYNSPINLNNSNNIALDTSKVNKRRRWDKSRLSVSFLNNSLDIGNISAPWQGNESAISLDISNLNVSKVNLEVKSTPKSNFRTTPSGTSTPLHKDKPNLLRKALLKDKKDVTINTSKNRTQQIEKSVPKIVRTKIPNFALIHQRAFDKLENIKEMSERKATRAKLLLSGRKPPSETTLKNTSKSKELKFNGSSSSNKSVNKSNISIVKVKKISPSKSNPKVLNKENRLTPIDKKRELLKAKSQIPKAKPLNTLVAERKGFTRFGFKIGPEGVKTTTKDEQLKAVASKTKITKNTVQERRNAIEGVRSNRRFQLLMKMRNK